MKIAVVGTRGIPATFGGIERHCEEVYKRLVNLGHSVTIYVRKNYLEENLKEYNGIKLIPLDTFKSKYLENIFHTFVSLLQASRSDADIIHFHAQGPCMLSWIPKILAPEKKLVFTCHGLDWQRDKWNKIAKSMIYFGEILSATLFDTQIMVSNTLEKYYKETYQANSITIVNGTELGEHKPITPLKEKFGIDKKGYLLFVGRLVPEKAPHKLIEAFKKTETDKRLVIVGGSASTNEYENYLKEISANDKRIVYTSYLYGDELKAVYSNAYMYISTSELEGLPLTLLEAMSYGTPTAVSDIDPHIEVVGKDEKYGFLLDNENIDHISKKLQLILDLPESVLENKAYLAKEKIKQDYNWDTAAKKHDIIYRLTLLKNNKIKFSFLWTKIQKLDSVTS